MENINSDVKVDNGNGNFKFRVSGILIHDDEVLAVKIKDNSFYCLPGGHVKIGEDIENAIIREFEEETGYKVTVNKLLTIAENFFIRPNGVTVHELGFYFLLNLENKQELNKKEYDILEEGMNLHFKWIPIKDLKNENFKPYEIKEKIENGNTDFQHLIIK